MKALSLAILFLCCPMWLFAADSDDIGDGGLHKQDWFLISFKDIAEDIEEAASNGKRLAIVFEQAGCIYCKKMHDTIMTDPEVNEYLQAHYTIVQINMFGAEEVTDLDGEVLTEKTAAQKWGVMFTPTILFMPDKLPTESANALEAAVAALPGGFGKSTFLHTFQWVYEKGYEGDEHLQKYHARKLAESK